MPVVPPNTINDLPRDVRKEFERLGFERSVLQYTFSYAALSRLLDAEQIQSCIVAWKDDEAKALKDELGAKLTNIYVENGIDKTIRYQDPFGRAKDYIMMEGTSTSFSQNRALEMGTAGIYRWKCPECERVVWTLSGKQGTPCPHVHVDTKTGKERSCKGKLDSKPKCVTFDAEALAALFALATTKTKYVAMQARDVKEGNGR